MKNHHQTENMNCEFVMNEDIPEEPPPPGKDRHLGKQAVRWIAERITGVIEPDDRKGYVIKGPRGRKIAVDEIPSLLSMHEGYRVELKIYDDHDPDIRFRMAEALQGWKGSFTWTYSESIYVERIRRELERELPGAKSHVSLRAETIHIKFQAEGKHEIHYTLSSPSRGDWFMKCREGKAQKWLGYRSDCRRQNHEHQECR